MKKKAFLLLWVIIGLALAGWFFGPGHEGRRHDAAAASIRHAEQLQAAGDFNAAVPAWQNALTALPAGAETERARTRIHLARAQLHSQGLAEARTDMELLIEELAAAGKHPQLLAEARSVLAETQYYNTWLLRLEGAPREIWEPEVESARQIFRNFAEDPIRLAGERERAGRNLESAIRLARLELTDLQGMPIPSQCRGCSSCKGKKPNPNKTKTKPNDARGASGAIDINDTGD